MFAMQFNEKRPEPWRLSRSPAEVRTALWCWLLIVACGVSAQSNPPPAGYFRSYVSDFPDRPLVTVTVTGAVGVACFTIEETLPRTTRPEAIGSGGSYLPEFQVVRWGPFTNQVATNVSYRLAGPPGSYPVSGGAWMDGRWYFAPPETSIPIVGVSTLFPTPPPQVATPVAIPSGGAVLPTNVTLTCATPGAVIRYTLDGSTPDLAAPIYAGPLTLTQAVVLRARGYTNGFIPSVVVSESYAPSNTAGTLSVSRTVDTNTPHLPVVQVVVLPSKSHCFAFEEQLPVGLKPANITAGGVFLQPEWVVRWGPFTQTNSIALSYQVSGAAGSYPVRGVWSVDGASGGETITNVILSPSPGSALPVEPPQVATPVFTPASANSLPVGFSLSSQTPGAAVHFTLDGSVPDTNSPLYTASVWVNSNVTVRARAFTNGWRPSPVAIANYFSSAPGAMAQLNRNVDYNWPTNPLVNLTLLAANSSACVAVTESLPPGLMPTSISNDGNFLSGSNLIVWGPFFGSNVPPLSYRLTGPAGMFPATAIVSIDGTSSPAGTGSVTIAPGAADTVPTEPSRVPTPVLWPAATNHLPVLVSISSPDSQAQVFYTTDGSLPSSNSALYTIPVEISTPTTLRARAFRAGFLTSAAATGNYSQPSTTNALLLTRSIFGSGTFIPSVSINAVPTGGVSCYTVTERIPPGVLPIDTVPEADWNELERVLSWGPYTDKEPRTLSYGLLAAWSGSFSLEGTGSFDGYRSPVVGASSVAVNLQHSGMPDTQATNCFTDLITYNLEFQPATNVWVTNVVGYLDWGDGTQSAVTNKLMTFNKVYAAPGTYSAVVSVDWKGVLYYRPPFANFVIAIPKSGHAVQTNIVTAVAECLPVIVTQPQPTNQSAWAGENVQISMSASSAFPLHYQWYFNATNTIVSPATFNVLTLGGVRPEASGLYFVVVTNNYGSVTSHNARLLVATPQVNSIIRNPNGSFTLSFSGLPNRTTRTWAASNLNQPVFWQPISTNSSGASGVWQVTDTQATNFQYRFYRFSAP